MRWYPLVLVVAACSKKAPSPVVDASAAPAPLTMPAGANAERFVIATSICAAGFDVMDTPFRNMDMTRIGCRSHPPFDKPGEGPDGKILDQKGNSRPTFCIIDALYHGSFTRPGAKEVFVSFLGCAEDDLQWDMGNNGSGIVVEEANGKYREVAYVGNVNVADCKQSHLKPPADRDVLICESGFAAAMEGTLSYFFTVDMSRPLMERARTMLYIFGDEYRCDIIEQNDYRVPGETKVEVKARTLEDVNADGVPDFVVSVERSRTKPSAAQIASRCTDPSFLEAVVPRKTYRLEIVSGPDGFALSPATKALQKAWAAEVPPLAEVLRTWAPPPAE